MKEKTKHWIKWIAIIVILFVGLTAFFSFAQWTESECDLTMTVNGQFDRVELLERHYGNWNGERVAHILVAWTNITGTVPIDDYTYYGNYQENYNYLYQLSIYWGTNHLYEDIDVMGGYSEEFVYLNVTIVISLEFHDYVKSFDSFTATGIPLIAMIIPAVIAWTTQPKDKNNRY